MTSAVARDYGREAADVPRLMVIGGERVAAVGGRRFAPSIRQRACARRTAAGRGGGQGSARRPLAPDAAGERAASSPEPRR